VAFELPYAMCVGRSERQKRKSGGQGQLATDKTTFATSLRADTKGGFMKHLRSILFAATALLLVATAVHAQSTNVTASVPFDFVVADHTYPAGDYAVKSISTSGVPLLIRNSDDTDEKGIALSNSCSSGQPSSTTRLVFHRMGGQYFLYQIWQEGSTVGREFPTSKTEVTLARNSDKPEIVIVAANLTR